MVKPLTSTSSERPLPAFEVGQAQTEVNFIPAISCSPFRKQAGVYDVPLLYERVEEGSSSQSVSSSHLSKKRIIIEETVQHGSNQIGRRERKISHTCDGAVNLPNLETTTEHELATLQEFQEWQDDLSWRTLEGAYIRNISEEEDAELEPFQPARKKQKFSHDFEDTSSDTDSATTVTNSESAEPESDGDLSADEDSRVADNGLMLLAIAASLHQKRK